MLPAAAAKKNPSKCGKEILRFLLNIHLYIYFRWIFINVKTIKLLQKFLSKIKRVVTA